MGVIVAPSRIWMPSGVRPKIDIYDPSLALYLPLSRPDFDFQNSAELLTNTGFEDGDPPTGWTLAGAGASWARSNEQAYAGDYSGKLTRAGADCFAYQGYTGYAKYKGLNATLTAQLYATIASRARLHIYNGVTSSYSLYHTGGSSWELLSATNLVSPTADRLNANCHIDTGDTSAYFDEASMYIPDLAMERSHYGDPVQKSGAIWTPQGYRFDGDDFINITPILLNRLAGTTQGTWMAWVKLDDATPAAITYLIAFGDTDTMTCFILGFRPEGYLFGRTYLAGTEQWRLDTDTAALSDGVCAHVALIQDGASPVLLVNGIAVAQSFITSTDETVWFSVLTGLDNGRIGCFNWNNGGNAGFITNGNLDDVIISTRVWSIPEVQNYVAATRGRYGI